MNIQYIGILIACFLLWFGMVLVTPSSIIKRYKITDTRDRDLCLVIGYAMLIMAGYFMLAFTLLGRHIVFTACCLPGLVLAQIHTWRYDRAIFLRNQPQNMSPLKPLPHCELSALEEDAWRSLEEIFNQPNKPEATE